MLMNRHDFEQLCRAASVQLQLFDPDAMGAGGVFWVGEVECELVFNEVKCCAQMSCELGDPQPGAEADVYRRLLEIQATFSGQIDAMFVSEPINNRLLFTVRVPLNPKLTGADFAEALKVLAELVEHWRATGLLGLLIDYEREYEERVARANAAEVA